MKNDSRFLKGTLKNYLFITNQWSDAYGKDHIQPLDKQTLKGELPLINLKQFEFVCKLIENAFRNNIELVLRIRKTKK